MNSFWVNAIAGFIIGLFGAVLCGWTGTAIAGFAILVLAIRDIVVDEMNRNE